MKGGYPGNVQAEVEYQFTEKMCIRDRAKIDAPVDAKYTAQDWEGFQELVSKSNIQDKELILRVLSCLLYTSRCV